MQRTGFCPGQPGQLITKHGCGKFSKVICGAATNLHGYLTDNHERDERANILVFGADTHWKKRRLYDKILAIRCHALYHKNILESI